MLQKSNNILDLVRLFEDELNESKFNQGKGLKQKIFKIGDEMAE